MKNIICFRTNENRDYLGLAFRFIREPLWWAWEENVTINGLPCRHKLDIGGMYIVISFIVGEAEIYSVEKRKRKIHLQLLSPSGNRISIFALSFDENFHLAGVLL